MHLHRKSPISSRHSKIRKEKERKRYVSKSLPPGREEKKKWAKEPTKEITDGGTKGGRDLIGLQSVRKGRKERGKERKEGARHRSRKRFE